MKKLISLLLVLAMVFSLAACGGAAKPAATEAPAADAPAAPAASEAPAAPAVIDNTLYISNLIEGNGDKIAYVWNNIAFLGSLMYRTLFLAETDLVTLKDDLASADYTVSEDGLVYTINFLGGKWSDGTDLTLDDVVFSIGANLKVATSNGIYTGAFSKIEGADAWKAGEADSLSGLVVDGNTLTITLTTPHSTLPQVLAQFAILPAHCFEGADLLELHNNAYWSKPVTSGMYTVDEMNAGNYYTLVRNEYYEGTAPKIEKVVVNLVADLITATQAGQNDVTNTNNVDMINELNKLDFMTMFPVDILFFRYFICNMEGVDGHENPPMQDIRVRQAVLHAIDRETLAESLFPGLANVCNMGTEYEYNPEKAKALLEEAGYDFNHTFRILYYYSDQGSIDFMEAIAYYLGEVGMKVEVTQSSNGTQDLFQTRDYDVGYKGLSAFDISEWYGEYNSTNSNFQNIFGGDTAFDDLIAQYAAATSTADKEAILAELGAKEAELAYKLPLFTLGNNMFVNTGRVQLPADIVFGNPWYKTDIQFEQWEIVG